MSDDTPTPNFTFNNDIQGGQVNLTQGQHNTVTIHQTLPAEVYTHLNTLAAQLAHLPPPQRATIDPHVQDVQAAAQQGDRQRLGVALSGLLSVIGVSADLLSLGDHYAAIHGVIQHAVAALGA